MKRAVWATILGTFLMLRTGAPARAGWEVGTKAGFDTNVSRSVEGTGKEDAFLSAYAGYGTESPLNGGTTWFFTASAEGTAHAGVSDLDSLAATLSPGLRLTLRPTWTLSIAPFVTAKGVRDSDQSAIAVGGRVRMKQALGDGFVLGEQYAYTSSRANADVYSYGEHALGVTLGKSFTDKVSGEIGYEYGRGDSYRSVGAAAGSTGLVMGHPIGGAPHMFSTAFGGEVVRERVDRHTVGVSAEYDWSRALYSVASYGYTIRRGELGSSNDHSGFVGLGYRY